MRHLAAPLLAVVLLSTCGSEPPPYPGPPAQRAILRVLDINVWSGLDYQGSLKMGEYESAEVRQKRYRALLAQIRRLDPDLIGVHEANKLPEYAERLARDLDYDAFWHVGVGGVRLGKVGLPWNLREGDVILTRRDLRGEFAGRRQLSGGHVGNFFTFHFSDATQILAVKVTNFGEPLYVFATHWHASLHGSAPVLQELERSLKSGAITRAEYEAARAEIRAGAAWRLAEAEKTLAFIQRVAGEHPFVLVGDFNALPDSPEIRKLLGFGLVDAFAAANPGEPGYTWDPATNLNIRKHYLKRAVEAGDLLARLKRVDTATAKRVDYIFVDGRTQTLRVNAARVVMNEIVEGVHASDHYGVFAEIAWASTAEALKR